MHPLETGSKYIKNISGTFMTGIFTSEGLQKHTAQKQGVKAGTLSYTQNLKT